MSSHTEQSKTVPAAILSLRELAELLVKHKGLHEGRYNAIFQLQIAVGAVGPAPEAAYPGAMLGVSGVGLEKVEQIGPHTIDAAIVNPARSNAAKKLPATSARKRGRSVTA